MPTTNGHGLRLDSWKEIAAYLRRDERTAIRWEKDRGLPVYRVPGGKRQAVFAYAAELDAWLRRDDKGGLVAADSDAAEVAPENGSVRTVPQGLKSVVHSAARGTAEAIPIPARPITTDWLRHGTTLRILPSTALALALIVIVGLGAAFLVRRSRNAASQIPVRLAFTADSVQAFDNRDKELWTYDFKGKLDLTLLANPALAANVSRIADFRGDGQREALVAVLLNTGPNTADPIGTQVDLLSAEGRRIWHYVPRQKFQFGSHTLEEPWMISDVFVSFHDRKAKIWLAFIHPVWGNAFVVNLDPADGKDTLRYVNTGTIRSLNEVRMQGKDFLLAGGFNNEPDTGSLGVIDEGRAFAASPQSPGTRHQCVNCPAGQPDCYFVFPRSEINELRGVHEDAVLSVRVTGDQVEVIKGSSIEKEHEHVHYILRADKGFRPISMRFNSDYDASHRKLEQEGRLHHSLAQCPERLHPRPIKMWTPSGGWTEIQLPPTPFNQ